MSPALPARGSPPICPVLVPLILSPGPQHPYSTRAGMHSSRQAWRKCMAKNGDVFIKWIRQLSLTQADIIKTCRLSLGNEVPSAGCEPSPYLYAPSRWVWAGPPSWHPASHPSFSTRWAPSWAPMVLAYSSHHRTPPCGIPLRQES